MQIHYSMGFLFRFSNFFKLLVNKKQKSTKKFNIELIASLAKDIQFRQEV